MTKEILKNIIPSMLATLFTGFYVIVDGLFIGQSVGGIGLAAINVAWPIAAFIQALGVAIGTACGIYISYYRSKNDNKKIEVVMANSLIILLIYILLMMSLFFYKEELLRLIGANSETMAMATDYIKVYILASSIQIIGCATIPVLRNFGYYKTAAILLFIATLFNFLGDYIFIMVLNHGIMGAAIASVISQAVVMIVGVIILIKNKCIKLNFKIRFKYLLGLFLNGIAPFILTFSASFLIIIYNLFCLKYGGNDAVAAYTVVAYIIYTAQYISIGISDGLQPLLTYHYGLNDGKVNKYFYKTLMILVGLLGLLTLMFSFMRMPFANLFNVQDEARNIYSDSYFYFIFSFIPIGLIRIYAARFYSTNLNVKADIIVLIEPIITPIILFLFTMWIGINGIWLSYLIIQIALGLISILIAKIPIKELNFSKIDIEDID